MARGAVHRQADEHVVFMALRAGHGEAEKSAADRVHPLILHFRAQGKEAETGLVLERIFGRHQVAGDLRPHEGGVR